MDFNKTIGLIPDHFTLELFPEIGVSVTGESLRMYSSICASWLQNQGFKEIGIHMENSPEFLYLFAGALRSGVKTVVFNALHPAETELPLFDRERVKTILDSFPPVTKEFTPYVWRMDEPLLSIPTSGTSGRRVFVDKSVQSYFGPKGFRPLWRIVLNMLRIRIYICSPWYHNMGNMALLVPLCGVQMTEITAGHFNPDHMRRNINATRPNYIASTPTMLHRSICTGEIHLPAYLFFSGEHLPEQTIELLEKTGGWQFLYSSYGTTETGVLSHMAYFPARRKMPARILRFLLRASGFGNILFDHQTLQPQCTGPLSRNVDVRIMKDGVFLGEGEKGEIVARTRTMYSRQETGYYHTGDIGYLKDGRLFISGRKTFVINRSGEKFLPQDIERPLADLPGVRGVAAFGIPSPTHGEDICAAIESENGAAVITRDELEGRLPKKMIPQHLFFFESFPMTESGKTDIAAIRESVLKKVARP
jgi:acyl-CoA synthetase (AMP-forming)/AMP-acid ligase II